MRSPSLSSAGRALAPKRQLVVLMQLTLAVVVASCLMLGGPVVAQERLTDLSWSKGEAEKPIWKAVINCYHSGAFTTWLMSKCVGQEVDVEDFESCVTGGSCLGDERRPLPDENEMEGECGEPGGSRSKTSLGGITGVSTGGAITRGDDAAGLDESTEIHVCIPGEAQEHYVFSTASAWEPSASFNSTAEGRNGQVSFNGSLNAQIRLAVPPMPSLSGLLGCKSSSHGEWSFDACIADRALPAEYKLTSNCLSQYSNEPMAAYFCSAGRQDSIRKMRELERARECLTRSSTPDIAKCLGTDYLGSRERHWLGCISGNASDPTATVLCGLGQDLTPEQQIAASCAAKTGGNPKAFVACVGGELMAREFDKCWSHGIGKPGGCFGPNNEIFRYWNQVDGLLRQALGESNDAYRAFVYFKNNLLTPSASHDFVRAANTVLNDLQNGPGENNDIRKFGNAVGKVLPSLGKVFCFLSC